LSPCTGESWAIGQEIKTFVPTLRYGVSSVTFCNPDIISFLISFFTQEWLHCTLIWSSVGPQFIYKGRRDKFTIHSKAVVCQDVEMRGDITIGAGRVGATAGNCVLNPIIRNSRPPQSCYFRTRWSNHYWDELHIRGRNDYCQPVLDDIVNHPAKY
jgi:hypothetical protein